MTKLHHILNNPADNPARLRAAVSPATLTVRRLGMQEYTPVWRAMQEFSRTRDADTSDEVWLVEHPPVFTIGRNGRADHVLEPGDIPVIRVDRGGQVTYHGPGQLVVYLLVDMRRLGLGLRQLVAAMEAGIVDTLVGFGIPAATQAGAPGVYVGGRKIAALGLRVTRGCCYHGLALNVDMDLAPFARINPCGYPGLKVTQLRDLKGPGDRDRVATVLLEHLAGGLRGAHLAGDHGPEAAAHGDLPQAPAAAGQFIP